MSGRTGALIGAIALISLLAGLTVVTAVRDGVTALVVISLGILALLGFGVLGALLNPPDG